MKKKYDDWPGFSRSESKVCPLCEREVESTTYHHLIPGSKDKRSNKAKKIDGGLKVAICEDCHHQIHALFDNDTLKNDLNTIAKLKGNEEMQKFIKWIGKKDTRHNFRYKQSKKEKIR